MNRTAIRAIIRKDLRTALQNRGVALPSLIVPLFMCVLLPLLAVFLPVLEGGGSGQAIDPDLVNMMDRMPQAIYQSLAGSTANEKIGSFMVVYGFAPMVLIVPLMVSAVLAADSFAGEKERKTLEALFYSPTSDRELFTAKCLGPWAAAVAVGILSALVYAAVANVAAGIRSGITYFPNPTWAVMTFWVTPAAAGLGMIVMVFVSARAQGFQDAYQTGGMVVLPVLALVISQMTGVLFLTPGVVFLVGGALWALDIALLVLAGRQFSRDRLMAA